MHRILLFLGGLAGLSAVAMSAFAAHALPQRLDPHALAAIQSAIHMQACHAPALLFCALAAEKGQRAACLAGILFALGLGAFCGAIYGHVLLALPLNGVAPIGGTLMMAGWAVLACSAWRRQT